MIWFAMMACGGSDTFDADMKLVCDAPNQPEILNADPADKAMKLADYLKKNLKDGEVLQMFQSAATMDPEANKRRFEDAAKRAGIEHCAMLDL